MLVSASRDSKKGSPPEAPPASASASKSLIVIITYPDFPEIKCILTKLQICLNLNFISFPSFLYAILSQRLHDSGYGTLVVSFDDECPS